MEDQDRVTLEILEGPEQTTDEDGWEHFAYRVELSRGDIAIEVPWRAGLGITEDPTARDVLECLLSDAAGFENAQGFEDWAADYGYDTDSRKAEAIYRAVEEQTEKLRALLGDDFDAAVFPNTDHEAAARKYAAFPE